jgi:hypothetical protein
VDRAPRRYDTLNAGRLIRIIGASSFPCSLLWIFTLSSNASLCDLSIIHPKYFYRSVWKLRSTPLALLLVSHAFFSSAQSLVLHVESPHRPTKNHMRTAQILSNASIYLPILSAAIPGLCVYILQRFLGNVSKCRHQWNHNSRPGSEYRHRKYKD